MVCDGLVFWIVNRTLLHCDVCLCACVKARVRKRWRMRRQGDARHDLLLFVDVTQHECLVLPNVVMLSEVSVDLSKLDPEPSDFDLIVSAPHALDRTVEQKPPEVP